MKNSQLKQLFKKLAIVMLVLVMLLPQGVLAKGKKVRYTQPGVTVESDVPYINYVTIKDIKDSLKGKGPINVSFDIDDTLLFSSQYFQYGKTMLTPGSFDFLQDQKFWDLVAERGDEDSIPKKSMEALIKMHMERKDNIYFITGRTRGSQYKEGEIDKTCKSLQRYYGIKNLNPINYTADTIKEGFNYDKSYYIKKLDIDIHYGDSDDDILAAKEVGARPIRVFRAINSTNIPLPQAGGYGEEVLRGSMY